MLLLSYVKRKTRRVEHRYTVLHNHPLPNNHKTYPQLYYRDNDVQQGNSVDLTEDVLWNRIRSLEWTSQDSGVEGGF